MVNKISTFPSRVADAAVHGERYPVPGSAGAGEAEAAEWGAPQ